MRIITWNINQKHVNKDKVWDLLLKLNPDIVLLQEVPSIPEKIKNIYDFKLKRAKSKTGMQNFNTAVLVKGKIVKEIELSSEHDWVNKELKIFEGNFISCKVELKDGKEINVVSVYSPAWPVDKDRLEGIDVSSIKLQDSSEIWATEIIWSALKNRVSNNETWVVGGDYNSSETFDKEYQKEHNIKCLISGGNKEIRDRMYELGFKECLLEQKGKLTPTYKNKPSKNYKDGQVIHQIDHLYVSKELFSKMNKCEIGNQDEIFSEFLSDHLPIIADFNELE